MKRLLIALALCCSLLAAWAAAAKQPAPEPTSVLARLQKTASGVKTIAGSFVQERHLAMLRKAQTARGRFYFCQPSRIRWEVTEPVRAGFVINGDNGRRWRPGEKPQSFEVSREPVLAVIASQLIAWARCDFATLQRDYGISVLSEEPVSLKLVPSRAAASKFLDHLNITFAPGGQQVRTVEVFEKGGDSTRITFLDTVINGPVEEGLFN